MLFQSLAMRADEDEPAQDLERLVDVFEIGVCVGCVGKD